jgi:large-conductance mechanosensitive channel
MLNYASFLIPAVVLLIAGIVYLAVLYMRQVQLRKKGEEEFKQHQNPEELHDEEAER